MADADAVGFALDVGFTDALAVAVDEGIAVSVGVALAVAVAVAVTIGSGGGGVVGAGCAVPELWPSASFAPSPFDEGEQAANDRTQKNGRARIGAQGTPSGTLAAR